MRRRIVFLSVLVILCAVTAFCGCTQQKPQPEPTPIPTIVPTTLPPTTTATAPTALATKVSIEPEPTDLLPDIYRVEVSVDRNSVAITPDITVTFNGGKGMSFVSMLDAQVIRSDGTTETKQMYKPQMGEQITLGGTKGVDRVVVYITLQTGERYKTFDEKKAFKSF